jgi:Fur family transcriptional regulator, ferric uptake regulator
VTSASPRSSQASRDDAPHAEVAGRLGHVGQRYTAGRRALVDLLHRAGRPLEIPEILDAAAGLPQSSTYRNLAVLERAGAVIRHPGAGGTARYELSEALVGHHHHLVCDNCGRMEDYEAPAEIEGGLQQAVQAIAARSGFKATGHSMELRGLCSRCS